MFVSEDTPVHTLQGDIPAGRLAVTNATVHCFTWSAGRIIYGRVTFEEAGEQEVQRVVLDNGKSILLSPSSTLLNRAGEEKPLLTLPGKSVMPLYLSETTHGYPTYRQVFEGRRDAPAPCDRKPWRSVARMVWEHRTGRRIQPGFLVRHVDKVRRNCDPGNLKLEGRPQQKGRRTKTRQHIEAQRMKVPNNHKLLGFEPWGRESCVKAVPIDCTAVAMGEIFVVTHGA
jgi:hypothetical protein